MDNAFSNMTFCNHLTSRGSREGSEERSSRQFGGGTTVGTLVITVNPHNHPTRKLFSFLFYK